MLKELFEKLTSDITASNLIERFGGYSIHVPKKGKEFYYGVSCEIDCKGNVTYDDRYKSVAYYHLLPISTGKRLSRSIQELEIVVNIEVFEVSKLKGEKRQYYDYAIGLFHYLKSNGYNVTLTTTPHEKMELSTITIRKRLIVGCDFIIPNNPPLC